jgi:hypothetical protein
MTEAQQAPAPGEMRDEAARLGSLPGNEKEKDANERPADNPADDHGDENGRHHDDEFLGVEPEDLDRPVQELW